MRTHVCKVCERYLLFLRGCTGNIQKYPRGWFGQGSEMNFKAIFQVNVNISEAAFPVKYGCEDSVLYSAVRQF